METHRAHPLRTLLLGAGVLLLGSSCVSQARHDEALANVKYYQRSLQDLESFSGKLEAENERLRGELGLEGKAIPAVTDDIDERLAELARIMEGIGGAAGDVTVLQVEGGYGLRMSDAILFDSGSAALKEEGKALLLKMAGEIRTRPFLRLWVRGHTDSDPVVKPETMKRFPHGNIELSAARAVQVAALLSAEGGIASNKLVVVGFGPSDPVADNSAAGKQKNRRVELFVIEEETGGK